MDRTLNIKINIDGIELPLTIKAEDEETYRKAALEIQQRIRNLRSLYPTVPDPKYYYAMALLNTAVDAVSTASLASTQPYLEMMEDLEKEISRLGNFV